MSREIQDLKEEYFDPGIGSVFFEVPAASIGANTGVSFRFRTRTPIRLISVTATNQTRPLADSRPAFFTVGNEPDVGKNSGMKHISGYNDGDWRLNPPIQVLSGQWVCVLAYGDANDVIGCHLETSESVTYVGRVVS